jgi:hypothetical protein
MKRTRRKIDAARKAKIALEAEQAVPAFDAGAGQNSEANRDREIGKLHADWA